MYHTGAGENLLLFFLTLNKEIYGNYASETVDRQGTDHKES